ncbi:MAG TPA: peptide chain release factor N(5)-glutamine methyltransferase [Phycisphaeraceae bacterium]|nr:peptide chain release factor N(5)-glutamine methyltransferase [Phycisphaeraceae bacterium]
MGNETVPETTWTTRRLLNWITGSLADKGVDSPRLCAEMLLAHVLGCDRMRLYMEADRPASNKEKQRLRRLVSRALRHEPIQYLVGSAWFYGLQFKVNPQVLVPRPSTETLVEKAIAFLKNSLSDNPELSPLQVLDVGTGSGAVAVSLAVNLPDIQITASDISTGALAVAAENARLHNVGDRITFTEGDLLKPFITGDARFAAVISNPPYIPDSEWEDVPANVRNYEPTRALHGGGDGLDLIRPLISQAVEILTPGGLLLIEHAASHAEMVRELARETGHYQQVQTISDLEGHPRVLMATRC